MGSQFRSEFLAVMDVFNGYNPAGLQWGEEIPIPSVQGGAGIVDADYDVTQRRIYRIYEFRSVQYRYHQQAVFVKVGIRGQGAGNPVGSHFGEFPDGIHQGIQRNYRSQAKDNPFEYCILYRQLLTLKTGVRD